MHSLPSSKQLHFHLFYNWILLIFFQDNWFGVLHHVAGEHELADGECNHGPLVETEIDKIFLDKNSKALEAIRKIVTDPKFLKALGQYVTFR